MPRRAKGPRLYLDPRRQQWIIRDGHHFIRTGSSAGSREHAEKALADYIGRKYRPTPSATPLIDEVLAAYGTEHGPHTKRPDNVAHTISNLLKWWSGKRVSDVSARSCRSYTQNRPVAAARRDLETLRGAIRYWHREYGPLPSVPAVVLPPKPQSRDRWLTRSEAARLLKAARHTPHLARFILIGLYTGTRSGAILAMKWDWIDLDRGVMRRRDSGEAEDARKRRPPVRLGRKILTHLRRWQRLDLGRTPHVIHYGLKPIKNLRASWPTARQRAGLDKTVTPHTLRHTRATWMMQAGVPVWQAAGSLGMSVGVLMRVYGHHSPDWQKEASEV